MSRDLTDHETRVLACLALVEGVLSPCPDNVAKVMGITPEQAMAAFKSLAAAGFIERTDEDGSGASPAGGLPS